MIVFRCDKNYQMFTVLNGKQKHQSIPNNPWQKIFCGLCSLNKRNGIAFVPWLHSFMTKTKVSSYVPLREKRKYHFTSLYRKSKNNNPFQITSDKRYFTVSVILNKLQRQRKHCQTKRRPGGGGGGGDSNIKKVGVLVVSFRGVNFKF